MSKNMILVIVEHKNEIISEQSFDAVKFAISLSSIFGAGVKALILTNGVTDAAKKLSRDFSIDCEVLVNNELKKYSAEAYTKVLCSYFKNSKPTYIVIPHTPQGYDYAPAIAVKLNIPCITSVTGVKEQKGKAVFQRLTAGGRVESEIVSECDKAVIAVNRAPGETQNTKPNTSHTVSVSPVNVSMENTVKILIKESEHRAGDLLRAPVVIAAGKGVGTEDNMSLLRDMARLFPGSSIAGSRGACDMGLTDYSLQVGMTGKSISPGIYFACGISGSPQHMAGLIGAKTIVAINRDPDAPIHRMADISIVERIEDFIPEFIKLINYRSFRP